MLKIKFSIFCNHKHLSYYKSVSSISTKTLNNFSTIIKKFDNSSLRDKLNKGKIGENNFLKAIKKPNIEEKAENKRLMLKENESNDDSLVIDESNVKDSNPISKVKTKLSKSNTLMTNLKHSASLVPKDSPVELLSLDQKTLYKYDSVQLLEVAGSIPLEQKNIPKLLYSLTLIRRKGQLKHYEAESLIKLINYLSENIDLMPLSYKVSLFFNLSKMNFFNNDKSIVYKIALSVMKNITYINTPIKSNFENMLENKLKENILPAQLIPIREVSNFITALSYFSKLNPKEFVFSDLFSELEGVLIMNFLSVKSDYLSSYLDTQSYSNIILAYSKTQNGSKEFYSILAEIANHLSINKTQELANIVYSYSNNINCDERLLFTLYDSVVENINKAKVLELVTILRAYNNKDLLDKLPELKDLIVREYFARFKEANPLDIAHIYNILADEYFEVILLGTKFARKSVYRQRNIKSNTISEKLKEQSNKNEKMKKTSENISDNGIIELESSKLQLKKNKTKNLNGVIVSDRIREYLIDKDKIEGSTIKENESNTENKEVKENKEAKKSINDDQLSKNEFISKSIIMNLKETATPEISLLDDIYKLVDLTKLNSNKLTKETKNAIKFFEYLHSQLKNLSFAFEGSEISLLYNNARIIYDLDSNLYSQLNTHIEYLMKKGKLKGKDADIIHFNIKDLPFKGEYNLFREKLEAYMRKIKYFI